MTTVIDKHKLMVRLPYVLPEWTRIIWSSEEIRQIWEPKIQRASTVWLEVEERSVLYGLRSSALLFIDEKAFVEKSKFYASKGLSLIPLEKVPKSNSYTSSGMTWNEGDPFNYRAVLTSPTLTETWVTAWDTQDNRTIGQLLGFPKCCIDFFQRVWVSDHYIDTTWPMYQNSEQLTSITANILLRWIGIRLVSHLPCSFDCKESEVIGAQNLHFMTTLGHHEEAQDIQNLLNLPIEWSAKHGIAEIKTPLFKISTRTDATGDLYVLQRDGSFYPSEAPSGNKFPYRNTQKNLITQSKSFKNALVAVNTSLWEDNGFVTKDAMDSHHAVIVNRIKELNPLSVFDFGCGNGELLRKIATETPSVMKIGGIEIRPEIAAKAQFSSPEFIIHAGDIFQNVYSIDQYEIGLISINRLFEEPNSLQESIDALLWSCRKIIIYSYDHALRPEDYYLRGSVEILNIKD